MTLAITEPVAEINVTTNATSYAFGAFTPQANAVLVVMAFVTGTVAAGTCTSNPTLTWTQRQKQLYNVVDTCYLYTAVVGSSPASTVVTINVTGDAGTGCHAVIFQITGADYSGTPIRQTAKGAATGANPVATFASAMLTGNGYCAAFGIPRSPPSSTPPTNWTEISDAGYASPTAGGSGAYRVNGETGTAVTFTSASGAYGILACEINVGPNITPLAVSGAMGSVSGALGKATAKVLAGSAGTLVGAVSKSTSKSFTGTAGSLAGVLASASMKLLSLAGTMGSMAGSLSRVPTFVLSLSGVAGVLSGATSKMTSKGFSGQAGTMTGGLGKSTGKQLSGATGSPSGSLGVGLTATKSLSGTVGTLLGSVTNQLIAGSTAIKLALEGVITSITGNLSIWRLQVTGTVKAIWILIRSVVIK